MKGSIFSFIMLLSKGATLQDRRCLDINKDEVQQIWDTFSSKCKKETATKNPTHNILHYCINELKF